MPGSEKERSLPEQGLVGLRAHWRLIACHMFRMHSSVACREILSLPAKSWPDRPEPSIQRLGACGFDLAYGLGFGGFVDTDPNS